MDQPCISSPTTHQGGAHKIILESLTARTTQFMISCHRGLPKLEYIFLYNGQIICNHTTMTKAYTCTFGAEAGHELS